MNRCVHLCCHFYGKVEEIPTDENLREIWGDLRRKEQGWEYPKVHEYGRVENQAGERVGVAKAPRLRLQQTAEPTALGTFARFGRQKKYGSILKIRDIDCGLESEKIFYFTEKDCGLNNQL